MGVTDQFVEALQTAGPDRGGDVDHRQAGMFEQLPGALGPTFADLAHHRGPQVLMKQTQKMIG